RILGSAALKPPFAFSLASCNRHRRPRRILVVLAPAPAQRDCQRVVRPAAVWLCSACARRCAIAAAPLRPLEIFSSNRFFPRVLRSRGGGPVHHRGRSAIPSPRGAPAPGDTFPARGDVLQLR